MMRDTDQQLASAKDRSQLFWLLGEGLLKGLTNESWSALSKADTGDAVDTVGQLNSAWGNLLDALGHAGEDAADRLAVEHTRLFAGLAEGAGPAPPYESAWIQGISGDVALAVNEAYAEAGFADIDLEAGPQDHLTVELKFMALLAMREAEAWHRKDLATAEARIRQQQNFLDHHILQWVPRWADQVAQNTQEPVYWAFVGLINAGLADTAKALEASVAKA